MILILFGGLSPTEWAESVAIRSGDIGKCFVYLPLIFSESEDMITVISYVPEKYFYEKQTVMVDARHFVLPAQCLQ